MDIFKNWMWIIPLNEILQFSFDKFDSYYPSLEKDVNVAAYI